MTQQGGKHTRVVLLVRVLLSLLVWDSVFLLLLRVPVIVLVTRLVGGSVAGVRVA